MEDRTNDEGRSQPGFGQGIAQMNEALQHSMTASKLMWAGVFAVGAGAAAYFWDAQRRTEFMDGARKWSDGVMKAWGQTAGDGKRDTEDNSGA